jgi:hypothetical protein
MRLTRALSLKGVGMRVTITWDNGHMAVVQHGDMREIQRAK